jgi:hypothetical protein
MISTQYLKVLYTSDSHAEGCRPNLSVGTTTHSIHPTVVTAQLDAAPTDLPLHLPGRWLAPFKTLGRLQPPHRVRTRFFTTPTADGPSSCPHSTLHHTPGSRGRHASVSSCCCGCWCRVTPCRCAASTKAVDSPQLDQPHKQRPRHCCQLQLYDCSLSCAHDCCHHTPPCAPPRPPADMPCSSTRPPCSRHTGCPLGPSQHHQLMAPPAAYTAHSHTHLAQGAATPAPAAAAAGAAAG